MTISPSNNYYYNEDDEDFTWHPLDAAARERYDRECKRDANDFLKAVRAKS